MKNIQDVLREKEAEIEKLNREIKLLRVAARMLEDEGQPGRAVVAMPHHADTAAMSIEEPALEVVPPSPPKPNGDVSKRWP